jgi:hypothetical protein
MKQAITLFAPDPDSPHPAVLVDVGSEGEEKWRDKGYMTEAELAEANTMTEAELKTAISEAEDIETLRFLADKASLDLSGKVTKVETAQAKLLEQLEG